MQTIHATRRAPWTCLGKIVRRRFATLHLEVDGGGGVASIWLKNGRKANPLSKSLLQDMLQMIEKLEKDRSVRGLYLGI